MKTSELQRRALDWAVAKAMGRTVYQSKSKRLMTAKYGEFNHRHGAPWFSPSTDWSQAGPIIERERIAVWGDNYTYWEAECHPERGWHWAKGETPLVAAMRCYVASKLGDEVEIPEELK